jgi:hypothetical protein
MLYARISSLAENAIHFESGEKVKPPSAPSALSVSRSTARDCRSSRYRSP